MKKAYFVCLLLLSFSICSGGLVQHNSREIFDKMMLAIEHTKTMKYTTRLYERINGRLGSAENNVKLSVDPFKAYIYLVAPTKGIEILYIDGENGNKALVNPNAFPYVSVYLDPNGSIMRKNQRHTILNLGFTYFAEIAKEAKHKAGKNFNQVFLYKGSIKWENYDCFVMIIDFPEFTYVPYTVKPNETVLTIAKKLKVSEYMILEINHPKIKDYYDVRPGQIIKVPNAFAKKTTLYIDKATYLPVMQAMFDEKGLFEKYEFRNLIANPKIPDEEFSKDYPGYDF